MGAEIPQLHKVTKALFIVQVQSRAREGPPFSVELLRGRPAIPNQIVTGAGRVPKPGKGDARWKSSGNPGLSLTLPAGRPPQECFSWASIDRGGGSLSRVGAALAEKVKTNNKRMPLRAVPLATALRPRRRGFEAAELRPLSFPVGFR